MVNQELNPHQDLLDLTLRPKNWQEYIGQGKVKSNLKIIIDAAKKRGESPEHLLFYGGSGLGKTTLSLLVAREIGKDIKMTSGPAIEKAGDLAAILTNLSDGDILFIDECHRLNKIIEEYLYPAMENFQLHIIAGRGVLARTMEMDLPRFTLIGSTTRLALLSAPLRSRFGATFQLDYYSPEDIRAILKRSAKILSVEIDDKSLEIIAQRSRFTPRTANRFLKRIRDFAQVKGQGKITEDITKNALEFLDVDEVGLEPGDRKVLTAIIKKFSGGPVGLRTLAAASSEEEDTILDIYEPYLMQLGFIERTTRGRVATKLAYQHLGLKYSNPQNLL